MVGELWPSLSGFKTMLDMVRTLQEMDNEFSRNNVAVELQEKILSAQLAQMQMVKRVHDLESELAALESWESKSRRYELNDFGGETFAYTLKKTDANTEPQHSICTNCFQERRISVLQHVGGSVSNQSLFRCPRCKNEFRLGQYRRDPLPMPQDEGTTFWAA